MSTDNVEIRLVLPAEFRTAAAEIIYAAFQPKFAPLIGSQAQGVAILQQAIEPAMTVVAFYQDQPAGIAGLDYDGRRFLKPQRSEFIRQFGPLSGILRFEVFKLIGQAHRQKDMYVDILAVAPALHSQGIGSLLLNAVFGLAAEKGFNSVSLEVVDTNPRARRFYERLGFVARRTYYYPYMRHIAGFSASIRMVKTLA